MLSASKSIRAQADTSQPVTALPHLEITSDHPPSFTRPCFAANINDAETGSNFVGIPLADMKWLSKSSPQGAVESNHNQSVELNLPEDFSEGFSSSIEVAAQSDSSIEHRTG